MRRAAQMQLGDIYMSCEEIYVPSLGIRLPVGKERPLVVLGSAAGSLRQDLPDVQVVPISLRVDMATDLDLICEPGDGPFRTGFIVEVWNARPVLVTNLGERHGELSERARARLVQLHNAMHSGSAVPDEWRGAPVTEDDDPRLQFQRDELRAAAYLSEPVDDMLASFQPSGTATTIRRWYLVSDHEARAASLEMEAHLGTLPHFISEFRRAVQRVLNVWRPASAPDQEQRVVLIDHDAASYVDEWRDMLSVRTRGYHVDLRHSLYEGMFLYGSAHLQHGSQRFVMEPRSQYTSIPEPSAQFPEEHDCAPL